MQEKRDYEKELSDIQRRREQIESSYHSIRREMEGVDDDITAKMQELSNDYNEDSTMKPDAKLLDIYNERDEILRDMKSKQREFDEQIYEEYKKECEALDAEESEIRAEMKADEEDEDHEEEDESQDSDDQ